MLRPEVCSPICVHLSPLGLLPKLSFIGAVHCQSSLLLRRSVWVSPPQYEMRVLAVHPGTTLCSYALPPQVPSLKAAKWWPLQTTSPVQHPLTHVCLKSKEEPKGKAPPPHVNSRAKTSLAFISDTASGCGRAQRNVFAAPGSC